MNKLRAIVTQENGFWAAQLLEIDVATQSETREGLIDEIAHMITAEYRVAVHLGRTPFLDIAHVPTTIERRWNEASSESIGILKLDEEVMQALSIRLEWEMPDTEVRGFCRAA